MGMVKGKGKGRRVTEEGTRRRGGGGACPQIFRQIFT